jgi:hypothetical protein
MVVEKGFLAIIVQADSRSYAKDKDAFDRAVKVRVARTVQ